MTAVSCGLFSMAAILEKRQYTYEYLIYDLNFHLYLSHEISFLLITKNPQ